MSYQHILLASDLIDDSTVLVEKAKTLAEIFSAELSLAHVVEPIPTYAYSLYSNIDLEKKLEEEAKAALGKFASMLDLPAERQHILTGTPKHEILKLAASLSCDLIILGSRSKTGLARLLSATTADIIADAHCDVLTVYHEEE